MKLKLLLGFCLIIILSLSVYMIGVFYIHYKASIKTDDAIPKTHIQKDVGSLSDSDNSWLEDSLKNSKSYIYPATEIKIHMDFRSPNDKSIPTKLVIDNLDDYKFFCLGEVLKEQKLEFAYYQSKNSTNIVVFLPSDKRRNQIMEDLKYFKIPYQLQ